MEVENIVSRDYKETLYKLVIEALGKGDMTAREIAEYIKQVNHRTDGTRSYIQPRLTELVANAKVAEVGKRTDRYTHRKVTVYGILREE